MVEDQCSIIAEFLRRVQAVIWNRRLMRTVPDENGSYRLGLVPEQTSRLDEHELFMCILYGCSVPVVLRKIKKSENAIVSEEIEDKRELNKARTEAAVKIQRAFLDRRRRAQTRSESRRRSQVLADTRALLRIVLRYAAKGRYLVIVTIVILSKFSEHVGLLYLLTAFLCLFPESLLSKVFATASLEIRRGLAMNRNKPTASRQSNIRDHYFELVGECYLHGMMNGEAIALQNNKNIKAQTFEIR